MLATIVLLHTIHSTLPNTLSVYKHCLIRLHRHRLSRVACLAWLELVPLYSTISGSLVFPPIKCIQLRPCPSSNLSFVFSFRSLPSLMETSLITIIQQLLSPPSSLTCPNPHCALPANVYSDALRQIKARISRLGQRSGLMVQGVMVADANQQ